MDVSSPPNSETKNVEMADITQANTDTNAVVMTQLQNQQGDMCSTRISFLK